MSLQGLQSKNAWPELPLSAWKESYDTLHLWSQIVGKIQLKLAPFVNHWWEVVLYVSSRGLTTSPMPTEQGVFAIEFDFIDHCLWIRTTNGRTRVMALAPRSVADFYQELMECLGSLGIKVSIDTMPSEILNPVRLDQDQIHCSYDREQVHRFWRILVQADRVMKQFRSGFVGKCSPVHFFWGSFDLAVTRFSGRRAPDIPGADHITQVAYSHEVLSCGFWPGSGNIDGPAFYAYAAPEPSGFALGSVRPTQAFYNRPTKGYVLMYDVIRRQPNPERILLDFFQSTYELGAQLGNWDRNALEPKLRADRSAA